MVIVIIRLEVDDEERRAINRHFGDKGLAARKRVRMWAESLIQSAFEDLGFDYDQHFEDKDDEL